MTIHSVPPDPAPRNDARVQAFEKRLVHTLNESGVLLMLSIGHRTGLLTALANAPPLTSAALAEQTGLQERYVREWFNALVAGGVAEWDRETALTGCPRSTRPV